LGGAEEERKGGRERCGGPRGIFVNEVGRKVRKGKGKGRNDEGRHRGKKARKTFAYTAVRAPAEAPTRLASRRLKCCCR